MFLGTFHPPLCNWTLNGESMKRNPFRSQLHRVWFYLDRSHGLSSSLTSSCQLRTSQWRAFTTRNREIGSPVGLPRAFCGVNSCTSSEKVWNNGHQTHFPVRELSGTPNPPKLGAGVQQGIEKEKVDCLVIGAGVVGLAIARMAAERGREVVVLEASEGIGTGTSSRNSEVIHAGIYYPPGSLKARLCVQGKTAMYAYCREREIPHKQVGKLIVATGADQIPVLEKLAGLGKANGVTDLYMISGEEAMQLEPSLDCVKALVSPSTGIVDSHAFMLALQTDAEKLGVSFAFNSSVVNGSITPCGIEIGVADTSSLQLGGVTMILTAKTVINAAGLFVQSVARRIKGLPSETIPKGYYAKGCYFSLSGVSKAPFTRLIYPVPEEGGIGVHVTMDLGGLTRFGPDVEWLPHLNDESLFPAQFDYVVDLKRGDKFYAEIRKYYPALPDRALQPGYSGIRPKLSGCGQPPLDFIIQAENAHGIPGLVNLYGIESPGLTSSFGIAEVVCSLIKK